MTIDFQNVADAIEKISPEIRNLMFSTELQKQIEDIANKNNLEEEINLKLTDEIGYIILGLKPRSYFSDSLTEIGINTDIANLISKEIESKVFSELDKIKNNSDAPENKEKVTKEPSDFVKTPSDNKESQPQNSVGNSFEQIILNQAKAMQPARPAGEVPPNLPSEPKKEDRAIHNYMGESDPYREPIS